MERSTFDDMNDDDLFASAIEVNNFHNLVSLTSSVSWWFDLDIALFMSGHYEWEPPPVFTIFFSVFDDIRFNLGSLFFWIVSD